MFMKTTKSSKCRFAVVLAVLLAAPVVVFAAGAKRQQPTPEPAESQETPGEQAVDHFNFGLAYRDKAWKLEEKAAAADHEKNRAKLEKKAHKTWQKAIGEFEHATRKNPTYYQAFGSLGYALRKTGQFADSLTAYDRALQIEPGYAEAIEYRAQAYLGLDRVEEAKQAYLQLFSGDRELADKLLEAMKEYVEARRSEGADAATLDDFSEWVTEREEIASQTASVSELRDRDW